MRTSLIAFCTLAGLVALAAVLLRSPPRPEPPLTTGPEIPEPPKLLQVAQEAETKPPPPGPAVPDEPYGDLRIGVRELPKPERIAGFIDAGDRLLHDLAGEGLTRWNPESLKAEPASAARWEHKEHAHWDWVFHLRADARWSDGVPLTADHFLQAWLRLIQSGDAGLLLRVGGAEPKAVTGTWPRLHAESVDLRVTNNGRSIEIGLKDDTPLLPYFLALPEFAPSYFESVALNPQLPAILPGTGRYRVVERIPNDRLTLERNPHHPDAAARGPARIVFRHFDSDHALLDAFEKGRVDWAPELSAFAVAEWHRQSEKRATATAPRMFAKWSWLILTLPPAGTEFPKLETHFRQSVAAAVDGEAVCLKMQIPALRFWGSLLPASQPPREEHVVRQDTEQAQRLWKRGGRYAMRLAEIEQLRLRVEPDLEPMLRGGREIARQLREILDLKVEVSAGKFTSQVRKRKPDHTPHATLRLVTPELPVARAHLIDLPNSGLSAWELQRDWLSAYEEKEFGSRDAMLAHRLAADAAAVVPLGLMHRSDLIAKRFVDLPDHGFGQWLALGDAGLLKFAGTAPVAGD